MLLRGRRWLRQVFSAYPPEVHRGRCLDLKAIAGHQLRRAGVAEVHDLGLCTICADPTLLFSTAVTVG